MPKMKADLFIPILNPAFPSLKPNLQAVPVTPLAVPLTYGK